MTALERAATLFAVAVILHNADHLRHGAGSIKSDVFVVGLLAIVLEVAIVVAVFARRRWAPVLAGSGGSALAMGYVATHFLPKHGFLSDSFTSGAPG